MYSPTKTIVKVSVDQAIAQLDRVEGFEAVDDRFVQAEALTDRLLCLKSQARVADSRTRRVAGQHPEQEEV